MAEVGEKKGRREGEGGKRGGMVVEIGRGREDGEKRKGKRGEGKEWRGRRQVAIPVSRWYGAVFWINRAVIWFEGE